MTRTRARATQALVGALLISTLVLTHPPLAGAANPWARVAAPSPSAQEQQLAGVSCVTPTMCTAVGYYVGANGPKTLIIRTTDGVTWTRLPSPSPGGISSSLNDVHCVSATQCTAVGSYASRVVDDFPFDRTLVLRTTNGTTWQRISTPNPFNFSTTLYGVNCVAATRCRAVGDFEGNSLVLRTGDGSNWFRQETPNLGDAANVLFGIDCVSNVNCTAVGLYYPNTNATVHAKTLALRTVDGRTWFAVATPNPSPNTSDSALIDVDCTSASACTAVGDVTPAPVQRGFILRTANGGTTWQRPATPIAPGAVTLYSVSCESDVSCTAVGWSWNAAGTVFSNALLRTTDGNNWASPSPVSERAGRGLGSVSCAAAIQCVAVGTFNATGNNQGPYRSLVMKET